MQLPNQTMNSSIDSIASQYITCMPFQELFALYNRTYCTELMHTVSHILHTQLTNEEVVQIYRRVLFGCNQDNEVTTSRIQMCGTVAKFYINIAHIFAVIVTTIVSTEYSKNTSIHIHDIKQLYCDSAYSFESNSFTELSAQSNHMYTKDVHDFYSGFTGSTKIPSNIASFSDISLDMYNSEAITVCTHKSIFYEYGCNVAHIMKKTNDCNTILISHINAIFVMPSTSAAAPSATSATSLAPTIRPCITADKLQSIMIDSRKQITQLYMFEEMEFLKLMKIYETIVEQTILKTTKLQIVSLKQELETLMLNGT